MAQLWSTDDDQTLLKFVRDNGPTWKNAQSVLPRRNSAQARARFYRLYRGERHATDGLAKRKCSRCAAPKAGHMCGSVESAREVLSQVESTRKRNKAIFEDDPTEASTAFPTPVFTNDLREGGVPPFSLDKEGEPISLAACLPNKPTERASQISLLRSFLTYPFDAVSSGCSDESGELTP